MNVNKDGCIRRDKARMNSFFQLMLVLLTWFTSLVNPAQAFSKLILPVNEISSSDGGTDFKAVNPMFSSQYFARSNTEDENNSTSAKELSDVDTKSEKVKIVFYKNADEFAATFDKAGTVSPVLREEAFELYKRGKWAKLEELFVKNNLNKSGTTVWPPANGGYNIVDDVAIKAGAKFDRYGFAIAYSGTGTPNLGGNFTSPIVNNVSFSFNQRALNLPENAYDFYYEIEVLQDLPFKGQTADIIPWFDLVGKGVQTMWKIPANPNSPQGYNYTFTELAQLGLIKITIKKSPSGKFPNLVNTVIQKQ